MDDRKWKSSQKSRLSQTQLIDKSKLKINVKTLVQDFSETWPHPMSSK